ncbi:MAG: hypothetical protein WDN01_02210 [Rhizomicrobium sp.]
MLARFLRASPKSITADRGPALLPLLRDRNVDPDAIASAGWQCLLRFYGIFPADVSANPVETAKHLEANELVLELLKTAIVTNLEVEVPLTGLRRRVLLSDAWRDFPLLVEALTTQAALNGGTWIFDSEEQSRLEASGSATMVRTYLPDRQSARFPGHFREPVTCRRRTVRGVALSAVDTRDGADTDDRSGGRQAV